MIVQLIFLSICFDLINKLYLLNALVPNSVNTHGYTIIHNAAAQRTAAPNEPLVRS